MTTVDVTTADCLYALFLLNRDAKRLPVANRYSFYALKRRAIRALYAVPATRAGCELARTADGRTLVYFTFAVGASVYKFHLPRWQVDWNYELCPALAEGKHTQVRRLTPTERGLASETVLRWLANHAN